MKILVIGSGGREHSIAECLLKSPLVENIYLAPGNDGVDFLNSKIKRVPLDSSKTSTLVQFAIEQKIDLTVVGPEMCLAQGLVDDFKKENLKIFGPTQSASQLESSKIFAKKIMQTVNIPTAEHYEFRNLESALHFIEKSKWDEMVIKCDGLAAGKGVVVCSSKKQAYQAVIDFMEKKTLGFKVESLLIEEMLTGPELSVFYLCDGNDFIFLTSACDHKRLLDHDLGPNTGGMGAFSPAPFFTLEDQLQIADHVVKPLLNQMVRDGNPFQGVLFIGLMKTAKGYKVLEFNTRFGDPETQTILPLLDEDLVPWLFAVAHGQLGEFKKDQQVLRLKNKKSIHVVMASKGYPGLDGIKIQAGDEIQLSPLSSAHVYFAGVKKQGALLMTHGGRVLGLTVTADSYTDAREKVYQDLEKIHFVGAQYRRDIGGRL